MCLCEIESVRRKHFEQYERKAFFWVWRVKKKKIQYLVDTDNNHKTTNKHTYIHAAFQ